VTERADQGARRSGAKCRNRDAEAGGAGQDVDTSGGIRIALTYGAGSDWVKNVLAADGCRLHTRGRYLDLTAPHLVHDPARQGIQPARGALLRLLGVSEFLDLRKPAGPGHP
jgi:hypothetical protein